jgi:hypothetical protein
MLCPEPAEQVTLKHVVPGTCEAVTLKHVLPGTCEAVTLKHVVPGTCGAGGRIKPGAQAPGNEVKERRKPAKRAAALSPVSRAWGFIFVD